MSLFLVSIANGPLTEAQSAPREVTYIWPLSGMLVFVFSLVDFGGESFPAEATDIVLHLEMRYLVVSLPSKNIFVTLLTAGYLTSVSLPLVWIIF